MDPLDPLTEIINSGQGFLPAIVLERIIWAMIGFFLLGAFSTSITKSMRRQGWFGKKSLFSYSKGKKVKGNFPNDKKIKDDISEKLSQEDK